MPPMVVGQRIKQVNPVGWAPPHPGSDSFREVWNIPNFVAADASVLGRAALRINLVNVVLAQSCFDFAQHLSSVG